jgi:hypothetical protein
MQMELSDIRRELTLAQFRVHLLERGLDPVYVRGLIADESVIEKLKVGSDGVPAADVTTVARELKVPRNAYRQSLTEDFSDFAERIAADGTLGSYINRTYVRPSKLKAEQG